MKLAVPREILENENRVAALPENVREYVSMGFEVLVETSAGKGIFQGDDRYAAAGARIVDRAEDLFAQADVVLKVKQPHVRPETGRPEAEMIRPGAVLITFLHPAAPSNHGVIRTLRDRKITAFTMDGIPRISRAQPMDALTSMSTVTGYKAVILAACRFPRIIPMIGTAVGTVKAARVLVLGAGVVGLQAAATAKRLGASVQAVDIHPAARKGAESLGVKIAGFDVPPEVALGEGGYAKALPPDWLEKERRALDPLVRESDIIIASALVPGEVAPVLITEEMVAGMKPGSVIVDVAADQGGNCALSEAGKDVVRHDVFISGRMNIPGSVPLDATRFYAANLQNFVKLVFPRGPGAPNLEDEIARAALVTHEGKIVHRGTLKAMGEA